MTRRAPRRGGVRRVEVAPTIAVTGLTREEVDARLAAAMSEKELETHVADACRTLGLLRYHTWRSIHSPAGFPDDVIVGDRVLYRELKREREHPTAAQQEWLDRLAATGADVAVWRPSDWLAGRITAELVALCSTRR